MSKTPSPSVTDPPFSPPEGTDPPTERRLMRHVAWTLLHKACRMVDSSISAHPYLTPDQRHEAYAASASLREKLTALMA